MKNPKKTITLILSPFLSVLIFFVLFKVNMTAKEVKPTFKTFPQNKDRNSIYYNESKSLTHQLLKLELDYKLITPNQYELARKNINDYLETASASCAQFLTNSRKFITCANNELGAYFPYKDSVDIGSNLSSHQSDCDSNVYLLHDIASRNGIKSRIRYLPEHALLWFRDNRGKENFYWETTAYENTGDIADFKNPKYLFSTENFYKTLYDNNDVIKIYPILLLGILPKDLTNKIIEDKSPLIIENPIRKEFYYWNLKGLSAVDVNALLKLKNKTPSSSNINLILSRHYLKENNLLLSSNYLHNIPPSKCKTMCLNIDAEINGSKTKRYFVRFLSSIFNIPDNIENQKKLIKYCPFIILIEIIILIIPLSSSLLKKNSINRDS